MADLAQKVVGLGIAGTPAGGVTTVQGDPAGTPLPISGTVVVQNEIYDVATSAWIPEPNSNYVQFLAPGSRTTTQQTTVQNVGYKGLIWVVKTTIIGTGSLTMNIIANFPNASVVLLASAAITSNTIVTLTIYPGMPNTANVSTSQSLPRTVVLQIVANNANPVTYSSDYSLQS